MKERAVYGVCCVGREREVARLQQWWADACQGHRQLVFVTGKPGVGKTTLVETFVASLAGDPAGIWVARGQCIQHYGSSEAYLPVLAALDHLCHTPSHARLLPLLRRYAPLWLAQLPGCLSAKQRVALHRELVGVGRERMLREIAVLLEVLTREVPLVLVWEDLQWSDPSTLDVLAVVARRREPARLLLLGTYRPIDGPGTGHPLPAVIQELHAQRLCVELALSGPSAAAVPAYLDARIPQRTLPSIS